MVSLPEGTRETPPSDPFRRCKPSIEAQSGVRNPFVVINVERRRARTGPVRRQGLCTKRRLSTVDRGRQTSQIVNPLLPALNPLALPAILTLLVATSSRLYWRGRGQGILRLSSTLPFHSAPFLGEANTLVAPKTCLKCVLAVCSLLYTFTELVRAASST